MSIFILRKNFFDYIFIPTVFQFQLILKWWVSWFDCIVYVYSLFQCYIENQNKSKWKKVFVLFFFLCFVFGFYCNYEFNSCFKMWRRYESLIWGTRLTPMSYFKCISLVNIFNIHGTVNLKYIFNIICFFMSYLIWWCYSYHDIYLKPKCIKCWKGLLLFLII